MKKLTYEEFTNLNTLSNLIDFILYLRDRNVIQFAEHVGKFETTVVGTISEMLQDWKEVAVEELKERNENLALGLNR